MICWSVSIKKERNAIFMKAGNESIVEKFLPVIANAKQISTGYNNKKK